MSGTRTVLVTGASGKQGHSVAEALLARGHKVRALTRRPDNETIRLLAAKGAEVAVGEFADSARISAAAQGADAAFLMGNSYEAGVDAETRNDIIAPMR